ncbi:hypothetical protein ACFL6I_09545 [candidate division KSB1 bacterium]
MIKMGKKNVFQKADFIRQIVIKVVGKELEDHEMIPYLCRAEAFHRGALKVVEPEIFEITKILGSNGLKPNAAYKCLRASMIPSHIKESVYGRRISVSRAMKMVTDAKEKKNIELETKIFDLGMEAIRRLNENATKNT